MMHVRIWHETDMKTALRNVRSQGQKNLVEWSNRSSICCFANNDGENMKLTTVALASAFALSSTFALAKTVRHKPSVRTYDLHRGIPLGRSGFLHPNYGDPDGATGVSAGGLMWNGRSASGWGGG